MQKKLEQLLRPISQAGALNYLFTYRYRLCFFPGGLIVSMYARNLTEASLSFPR